MAALPTRTDISGTPSKATAQAAFTAMYDYLAGLFGSAGTAATARSALAVDGATVVPSVAASALTLALKTAAGVDATTAVPLPIPFRSSTLSSGTKNIRQVTAALSLVVPSTATLGSQSGVDQWLYLYGLDNAGAVELAISGTNFGTNFINSTTAIAAASNSTAVIYSTAARASVAMTLLTTIRSNQTTAGTYAAVPVEVTYPDALAPASGYTFPDASVISTAASLGTRNRIINGDPRIDQRNAGAAITVGATVAYLVDRFYSQNTTATGTITGQQSSIGASKSILLTATAAVTDLTLAKLVHGPSTILEAQNVFDLNSKTVTVSFKATTNWTGNLAFAVRNSDSTRSYITNVPVVSGANTCRVTLALEAASVLTNSTAAGLLINIGSNNEATFQTATTGAWVAGNFLCSTTATQWTKTLNNTLNVTELQLEEGGTATPFERRPIGGELVLCQRYAQPLSAKVNSVATAAAQSIGLTITFPVTMRAAPTFSTSTLSNTNAGATTIDVIGIYTARFFAASGAAGGVEAGYTGIASAEFI